MAAVKNPFSITYGTSEEDQIKVGGDVAKYQLLGPYVIDKSFDTFRLVFDVVVVASSYEELHEFSDELELSFIRRDETLVIDIDGNKWTYTAGTDPAGEYDLLNVRSSISKSGDPLTDRGFSRVYTVVITSDQPAEPATGSGLREFEVNVDYESSRQRVVTMRGMYTKKGKVSASAQYSASFGGGKGSGEAYTILTGIGGASTTWELVDENFSRDRTDATCTFQQQYVELLEDQGLVRDDNKIKDHKIVFTDLSQFPGDALEDVYRLRRVLGTFDCAANIDVETDLDTIFTETVKPTIVRLFDTNFSPEIFTIEDMRNAFDETNKRISVTFQFLYVKANEGEDIIEISQSVAFRETRHIDFTPIHSTENPLGTYVDQGWNTLERIWNRTAIVKGGASPKIRISGTAMFGELWDEDHTAASQPEPPDDPKRKGKGPKVTPKGWNIMQNTSQVSDQWIGDPDFKEEAGTKGKPFKVSVLTETVVERWAEDPKKVHTQVGWQRDNKEGGP